MCFGFWWLVKIKLCIINFGLFCDLQKKALGSELYEQVFYNLDLIEKDYFGLQFTDSNHVQVRTLLEER